MAVCEPKLDGRRIQAHLDGDTVSVLSRRGRNIVERLPRRRRPFARFALVAVIK
jgi:ATP-dependent DNA ligase